MKGILKVAILDDYERVMATHPAIVRMLSSAVSPVELTVFDKPLGAIDAAADALRDFDAICLIRERMPFPAALIERLPKLRLLAFTGARNPSCDHVAAGARGIPVSTTPGGPGKAATAELAWALLLAAAKRIVPADAGMRAGHWRGDAAGTTWPLPMILAGRTLGLLGLGAIGQQVAGYGKAFGMDVIAWSPHLTRDRAASHGVVPVTRDALFETSDALSVHMVLAPDTRGLVRAADLARMKSGSILVNTSRAGLIDSGALARIIVDHPRRQVALDVYDTEPLDAGDPLAPLLRRPNAVLCPHLGYVNEPVFDAFAQGLAEIIAGWAAGEVVRQLED